MWKVAAFVSLVVLMVSGCSELPTQSEPAGGVRTVATPVPGPVDECPTPSTVREVECGVPKGWQRYTNDRVGVTFFYPPDWQPDPRQIQDGQQRYGGESGFFQVTTAEGPSVEWAAEVHVKHKLNLFGQRPRVLPMDIQGYDARLVLPSVVRQREMNGTAALFVRLPHPVPADIGSPRPFLLLWADGDHIAQIAETVRLVPGAKPGPTPPSAFN